LLQQILTNFKHLPEIQSPKYTSTKLCLVFSREWCLHMRSEVSLMPLSHNSGVLQTGWIYFIAYT